MKRDIFTFFVLATISSFVYASDISVTKDGASITTNETQIANIATANNKNSQNSMLRLSDDIGAMADRINQMADKINVMADKIVKTQEIQSQNLKVTEENILKAQKAIANALQKIDDPEIIKELQSAQSSLENIIPSKNKKIDTQHPTTPSTTKKLNTRSTDAINSFGGFGNMGDTGGMGDMGGMGGMGNGGF